MDELILDDKKYVSSKRAAKMTGYAKDYIGQLCREGRVTARLVGRSWYVLESAIHDHRFGEKVEEKPASPSAAVFSATWGEPRYQAAPVEDVLPAAPEEEPVEESATTAERLQESWKAWFDRVGEASAEEKAEEPLPEAHKEEAKEEAVSVPIRAIHHAEYQPLPHEILSRRTEMYEVERREEAPVEFYPARTAGKGRLALQVGGALLALTMAALAVAGSGYFDGYILANQKFGALAGVHFYNR